jgi:APA family basic amino acid/polyamine antiporter
MVPTSLAAWRGTIAGAFIAFFAFVGFETLANLAEEAAEPRRTVPRGILGAIAASLVLYVAVATAAVLADATSVNPLIGLFTGAGAAVFAAVGAVAVANGVLVEIVMLARLFYGMANKGQLPALLSRIHPRTRTPVEATLLAGAVILVTALFLPFTQLLVLANAVTLAVFVAVDLALWRVQRRGPPPAEMIQVPRWLPLCAAGLSLALMLAELAS